MPESSTSKTRYYQLEQFFLKQGSQLARLHDFFKRTLPMLRPRIVLEAIVAPHMPQVAVFSGFASTEEYFAGAARLRQTPEFAKELAAWEAHEEPPYEHYSTALLEATPYSSDTIESAKSPRIFELRVYHSPTWRQLAALHERFAGPEIRIFHRVGVHPVLYTSTVFGPHKPNLTYLIPFDSLAAREKAWNAFAADEEWIKVRRESIDKHGQISSVIQIALYKAADYSPVK